MSGALVTCPMEGMTGTMTGLGSVPLSSRGVLYGTHSTFSDPVPLRNGSRLTAPDRYKGALTFTHTERGDTAVLSHWVYL